MKSILVHVDASPRCAARLAIAQALAHRHAAEVTALYGVVPSLIAMPLAATDGMVTAAALLADVDREQRARARAMVEGASSQRTMTWVDGGETPYRQLMQHAPYADLLVLGQSDPADALTGALPPELVPAAISDSGRPTLVVPYVGEFEAAASRVLIAWKPTREAARALSAALPWLRLASQVHVASRPEEAQADFDHTAALRHWLQLQGVVAAPQLHHLGPGDVGEGLLSLAVDASADLLVMGCYGHSRSREWVLGGASRSVLRSMTLPVLMVH
jgi:nucleotide-binding universal stress UspA family protein